MDFDVLMSSTRWVLVAIFMIGGLRYIRSAPRRQAARGFDQALRDTNVVSDPQRQRTAAFRHELVTASQMPLKDAAVALWLRKPQLDRADIALPRTPIQTDVDNPATITIIFDWENAQYGPTVRRLKAAHPEASELELRAAIKSAVQLAKDGIRYFEYTDAGIETDARTAVALARNDNLGYLDATYEALQSHLCASLA